MKYLSLIFFVGIIYACASVSSPTGGEKDDKAPSLISSNPKDQSLNVKTREFEFEFDEWIKVENLQQDLIISPRIVNPFEHKVSKQTLTITFEEDFADSTTYTFNFRSSVKDITEGNLWEKAKISFSTGSFLDSLKIQGKVSHHLTQEPAKNITVALYDSKIDTANLREGKPLYFTTTDERGNYEISNIKKASYKLQAFNDANNDLMNQSATEAFGFYPKIINFEDSINSFDLSIYQENQDTLKINKFSPSGKDFQIKFNKSIKDYQLHTLNNPDKQIYSNLIEENTVLKIYKENFELSPNDSLQIYLEATDSVGQQVMDTIYVKFRESKVENELIKIGGNSSSGIVSDLVDLKVYLNKPIYKINKDSIVIKTNDEVYTTLNSKNISIGTYNRTVHFNFKLDRQSIKKFNETLIQKYDSINKSNTDEDSTNVNKPKTNYQVDAPPKLYFGNGAFIGIEKDSTNSKSISLNFLQAENFGIIKGKVIHDEIQFIIQLLDKNFQVIDTLVNKSEFVFNYVKPGEYKIRVIKDTNGNGKWDAGNPFLKLMPEEVVLLGEKLTVKANWELIDKNIDLINNQNKDQNNSEKTVDNSINKGE